MPTARVGMAMVRANARYWPTVAPLVRSQLDHWERRARAIADPALQSLALAKLHEERFNSEVAATLATLAPSAYRKHAIASIVAFEVMYDFLDGLTEQSLPDPLRDGHQLFTAFTDALLPGPVAAPDYYRYYPHADDGGYLDELSSTVRRELALLPAAEAVMEIAWQSAARCAEAQVRAHADASIGMAQLEAWAMRAAAEVELGWREFLAGSASSVLAVHALIAAAADARTTRRQAVELDTVYLSIGVLSTMLDSLVDYRRDLNAGQPSYLQYYGDHDLLARDLVGAAARAIERARSLPNGAHHIMTLVGVAAYYTSAPTARSEPARSVSSRLKRELRPAILPVLTLMRCWRLAKRLYRWRHR